MTFLPIVGLELAVAARRPGTYWLRLVAAFSLLAVWFVVLNWSNNVSPGQMGQHLLTAMGVLALAFSLLAGIFLTSDCLAEEKRQGTIGLLFLTDLKAYDIVLGKLVARSMHAFFGLLAVFPILGLVLPTGGVTGAEFARLILVLVVTLVFSLGLGMFASAVSRDSSRAIVLTFFLILLFAGVSPVVWELQQFLGMAGHPDFLLLPSPVLAFLRAFDPAYRSVDGQREFWSSIVSVSALGLGGIILASVLLPQLWQEKIQSRSAKNGGDRRKAMRHLDQQGFRIHWLIRNPMYWLAVRDFSSRRAALIMLACLGPLWLIALAASLLNIKPIPTFITSFCIAFGLHILVKVLAAMEASRRMNQDRESGALELLLVAPVSIRCILSGQMSALRHHFKWPMLALCAMNLAMAWAVIFFPKQLQMHGEDQTLFLEMFSGGAAIAWLDLHALGWVGMWQGLVAKRHHRAVLATVGQVMSVPWALVLLMLWLQPNIGGVGEILFLIAGWLLIGAVIDMGTMAAARQHLTRRFRTAVSQGRQLEGAGHANIHKRLSTVPANRAIM